MTHESFHWLQPSSQGGAVKSCLATAKSHVGNHFGKLTNVLVTSAMQSAVILIIPFFAVVAQRYK